MHSPTFPIIVLLTVLSGLRALPHRWYEVPVPGELTEPLLRPGATELPDEETIQEATPVETVLPPLQPKELWLRMVKEHHPDVPNPEVHTFKLVSNHKRCTATIWSTRRPCRGVVNGDSFKCRKCGGLTAVHWNPCPYNHKTGIYEGAVGRDKDVEEEDKPIHQVAHTAVIH
ncbi:uncharacterized protein PGTG_08762 [Puccinia graminis f. sp. tritici CRL 75-36-700-3]|uniref:Uncharacterized protein n=1 Tax=Puccinia graminis f. sp. tritici (strain CRL 75-36-700-3 / race SCCL) TaxID=418459 RepID=E3KEK9_PUCGT|nr:uncharacterized protein PGTG_08762 [Puccinia graminis f. sp. tritici CRL 75-36-700-3]EFP82566.1 hypothetical protein PGTG_08762 [Puccinia graminis f. sp. tritici CRL 75-36-700-3]